jgi:hypothetical protein
MGPGPVQGELTPYESRSTTEDTEDTEKTETQITL